MQAINVVPKHVAVVVDGNRRWAVDRKLPPWKGHDMGARKLEKFVEWAINAGVETLSIYSLSTENFRRSPKEIQELFDVMCKYAEKWLQPGGLLDKYEVKVNFIGDLSKLPRRLSNVLNKLTMKTAKYSKKILNILISYSGKEEIVNAMQRIMENMKNRSIKITPKMVEKNLGVSQPVDLVIRTGGKNRLSNFLLWQTSYAELYFAKVNWPDFTKRDFQKALTFFASTQRNFGV